MKISTCLAVALLSLSSMSAFAQDAESELKGELKFENVTVSGGYAQGSTPMVATSEGNIVVTGTTANAMSGVGSFIAMSAKDMPATPIWTVDLAGSNIVTSIVADADGGVFIGGNFKKALSLGSIDLVGNSADDQRSSFVAHINKNGEVVAAKAFVADLNEELKSEYYTEESTVCNLSQLAFANGKLYAGFTFDNILKSSDGSKQVAASLASYYGSKMAAKTYTIAQIDLNNMGIVDFPVVFGGKEDSAPVYEGFEAGPTRFVIDGSTLYLAAQTAGYTPIACLWINGEFKDSKEYHYESGCINGYYLAKIDMATNTLVASQAYDGVYTYKSGSAERALNSLEFVDGNLVLAGSFIQKCPLMPSIEAVGNSDLFVATLDKSDLSVKKVLSSKYDETDGGTNKYYFETYSTHAIDGKMLSISGCVGSNGYNGTTYLTPLSFNVSDYTATDALGENEAEATDEYITGTMISNGNLYVAMLNNSQTTYYYGYTAAPSTGINTVNAASLSKDAVIYNFQGMKLRAPQKGLNIVNGKKVVIK